MQYTYIATVFDCMAARVFLQEEGYRAAGFRDGEKKEIIFHPRAKRGRIPMIVERQQTRHSHRRTLSYCVPDCVYKYIHTHTHTF